MSIKIFIINYCCKYIATVIDIAGFELIIQVWSIKMNKRHCSIIVLCAAVLLSGCTMWNSRDWNRLNDKQFYFTKFVYVHRGLGKKKAMAFMDEFPVRKMLDLLEKRRGIEIDTAQYDAFLEAKDYEVIDETGFFQGNTYTWKDTLKRVNSVEFSIMYDFDVDEYQHGTECGIELLVKTGWRNRDVYTGLYNSVDEAVKDLLERLSRK